MSTQLFNRDEAQAAATLAEIPFSNPFAARRREMEREVLGDQYVEPARSLLPGEPLHQLEGNLGGLLRRADALMAGLLERIGSRAAVAARDREIAEGLAHLIVFHRRAHDFDGLISPAGEVEGARPRRASAGTLFERCRRDLEGLIGHPALRLDVTAHAPTWFAMYFQIRQAWMHTYAFIRDGSTEIRSLRERIW
ncbi:MAG TPA: hypothetical protein VGA56_24625, partial [Opitutaceae bacterium]